MSGFPPNQVSWLSDPRLKALALGPAPAWLWSPDATRLLWANPNGAAIFATDSSAAATTLRFDPADAIPGQILRLAGSLRPEGPPRLERLRGLGARIGAALTCQCTNIVLADGTSAILVAAIERAGPDLPLAERLIRLIAELPEPAAAFSADGELLHAAQGAVEHIGANASLGSLGAEELARKASTDGRAEGEIAGRRTILDRLGSGTALVLLARLMAPIAKADIAAAAEPPPPPVSAAVAPVTPAPAAPPAPIISPRRHPLRFIWQMDAGGRFTIESDEFIRLIGAHSAALLGHPWHELAAALELDPHNRVAGAVASRDTWSGITLLWPAPDGEPLPVELSGLPLFDVNRAFRGYRGFGVCRDISRQSAVKAQPVDAPAIATMPAAPENAAAVASFPAPALSAHEQSAFQELARKLGDRLKNPASDKPADEDDFGPEPEERITTAEAPPPPSARAPRDAQSDRPILDRLPIGVLVYRLNDLLYANRAFLEWTGYGTLDALSEAGGLDSLFIESDPAAGKTGNGKAGNGNGKSLTITTQAGQQVPVEGKLFSAAWNGDNALVLMINTAATERTISADKNAEMSLRRIEGEKRELEAVLDTATDGVLMLGRDGYIVSANRSAEALFALERNELESLPIGELFAPESRRVVQAYLDQVAQGGAAGLLNQGKEVIGQVPRGGLIPLYMTIGRIGEGDKLCAVLRDVTAWKKTEEDLLSAKHTAERASAAKSEFLAKISHEIRTPLNAIIGFSEVMMEERFGPVENERYRQYLRDIHSSGGHLVSLLTDLLDLSKIESGKLDLTFGSVNLNDVTQQCVAIMQEQANRERVIIRTALAAPLPQLIADARSVRQIVLNLLSNSIKFTGTGGQIIVSTTLTEAQEVVLRVRDTGAGMSEQELSAALEPFRQLATAARWGSSGTGLGLPITKALAEANHARFKINSAVRDGTLVEITFPANRVLAH